MGDARGHAAGRFAVDIGGKIAGICKKVDGGKWSAEVVNAKDATSKIIRRSLSGVVKVEALSTEFGLSMGQPLLDWINASFAGEHIRNDGAIIAADADNKARSRRDFFQALITEVGFPACDASSKDAAYMTIKFQPEEIKYSPAGGETLSGDIAAVQKVFTPANFRFELGSLPCKLVNKIDAFTWKQAAVQDDIGDARIAAQVPGAVESANLSVTIGATDFAPWHDWFTDFVINGNCAQENELTGSLTWLSQNRKEELARVDFIGVGIHELSEEANEAGKDAIRRFKVGLYVEQMKFNLLKKG